MSERDDEILDCLASGTYNSNSSAGWKNAWRDEGQQKEPEIRKKPKKLYDQMLEEWFPKKYR